MHPNNLIIIGVTIIAIVICFVFFKLYRKKPSKQKLSVQLVQVNKITHDTAIFTFALPSNMNKLGLNIGQHLQIEQNIKGQIVKRKYTPISSIDKVGAFQLLLKIYRPIQQFPNGGKMSAYLADLPLNSKITIALPFGRFNYLGKRNTKITDFDGKSVEKKYKNFYMIAGGTGITPIFQIIQYCCDKQTHNDRPNLYLLFANRTQNDILMKQVLDTYAHKNSNLKIYYSVDQSVTSDWTGFIGFVNEDKIKKTVPENFEQTLFISCGPPPLCNNAEKIWKGMNVNNEQIYRF